MPVEQPPARRSAFATPEQLAEWLQVPVERLRKLRKTGGGPKYIKVGRSVRYAWSDVHAWCAGNRTEGTRA